MWMQKHRKVQLFPYVHDVSKDNSAGLTLMSLGIKVQFSVLTANNRGLDYHLIRQILTVEYLMY